MIWIILRFQNRSKKLEAELGVQLLNRSTRTFSLTPAGEEILEQAHQLVGSLDNVKSIADSYQAVPKGRIRITAPLHIGQGYLQPVISQFMATYPDVEVVLMMDDKRSDIISEHFDVAFRLGRLDDSSLIAKKSGRHSRGDPCFTFIYRTLWRAKYTRRIGKFTLCYLQQWHINGRYRSIR